MITISTRRTLVALATTAALLPAAPALAQSSPSPSVTPTPSAAPTATPTAAPTAPPTGTLTPAPVAPQLQVDRTLIEFGDTHRLTVTGRAGAAVQLFGNGRVIRTVTVPASGQFSWELQPGDRTVFRASVDGVRTPSVEVRVRRAVSIGVQQANGVYTFTGSVARAEAGVQVTIARLDGETNRVTGVASTRTTADGRYEIRTSLPVGLAGYYALTSAQSNLEAGRSRLYGLLVNVRPGTAPAQSLTLDVRRAGNSYTFEGRLSPARSGVPVTLARVVNGRLEGVAGGITEPDGRYIISIIPAPGTYSFQAVAPRRGAGCTAWWCRPES